MITRVPRGSPVPGPDARRFSSPPGPTMPRYGHSSKPTRKMCPHQLTTAKTPQKIRWASLMPVHALLGAKLAAPREFGREDGHVQALR